jgi:hypothetical protein
LSSPQDWHEVEKRTRRVFEAVDWAALGAIYFHEDGERHWAERRKLVVELGSQLARRLARQVERGGASLWVGAGVAELPVLLGEVQVLGRSVVASNLIAEECDVRNAALAAAAPDHVLRYEAGDAQQLAGDRTFDHVGCISVFTDPERWPALSGVSYGRLAPVQLDVEQFVAEREQARALAAAVFARLRRPGCITTSAEEVSWFLELCEAQGLEVEAADDLIETAVVGDPVGFLSVRAP